MPPPAVDSPFDFVQGTLRRLCRYNGTCKR
jgi:hypothetical protein